jgi:hypothetical protein
MALAEAHGPGPFKEERQANPGGARLASPDLDQYLGAAPPPALQDDLPLLAGAAPPPPALQDDLPPPDAEGSEAGGGLDPPHATAEPISIPATADTARAFAIFMSPSPRPSHEERPFISGVSAPGR